MGILRCGNMHLANSPWLENTKSFCSFLHDHPVCFCLPAGRNISEKFYFNRHQRSHTSVENNVIIGHAMYSFNINANAFAYD